MRPDRIGGNEWLSKLKMGWKCGSEARFGCACLPYFVFRLFNIYNLITYIYTYGMYGLYDGPLEAGLGRFFSMRVVKSVMDTTLCETTRYEEQPSKPCQLAHLAHLVQL